MMRERGRRIAIFSCALLVTWVYRLWFSTCRIRTQGYDPRRDAAEEGKPVIGTSWHYSVLGIFAIYKDYPVSMLVSASRDGEYLASVVNRLGFPVVRGSSNRYGAKAARELLKALKNGHNTGIVADGSQGPARIAQSGTIFLASKSGGIIVPMVYTASRYFAFNTWDKLILPKPFSRIDVYYGEPFQVPEKLEADGYEFYRLRLEQSLNEIYTKAWGKYGKVVH